MKAPGVHRCVHRLPDHLADAAPDFGGIVLHPAGPGIDLRVLLLCSADDSSRTIEDHEARAGGSLVNGCDVVCHLSSIFPRFFRLALDPCAVAKMPDRIPVSR